MSSELFFPPPTCLYCSVYFEALLGPGLCDLVGLGAMESRPHAVADEPAFELAWPLVVITVYLK